MANEQSNSQPILARITINDDEFKAIRQYYRKIATEQKQAIADAVKNRNRHTGIYELENLIAIMAVFAKFTTHSRDIALIQHTFGFDQTDIDYLIQELAPPDDSRQVIMSIDQPPQSTQMELFPRTQEEIAADEAKRGMLAVFENIGKRQAEQIKTKYINCLAAMAQGAGYNAFQYTTEKNSDISILPAVKAGAPGEVDQGEKIQLTRTTGTDLTLKVTLTNHNELVSRWRPSAKKLYEYANILLTAQNHFPSGYPTNAAGLVDYRKDNPNINRFVQFTLEDWCNVQGIKSNHDNIEEIRERVTADLQTILYTTLEWEEVSKRTAEERKKQAAEKEHGAITRRRRHWAGVNLVTSAEIKDGCIFLAFSPEMANYLLNSYIMKFPTGLLAVDDRNPNAYAVGRKLAEHYYNTTNQRNKRNSIIAVATVLDCTDLPSVEFVKRKMQGAYKRKIIQPFIQALKAVEKVADLKWEFCAAGGEQLPPDAKPAEKIKEFEKAYIRFTLPDDVTDQKPMPKDESDPHLAPVRRRKTRGVN